MTTKKTSKKSAYAAILDTGKGNAPGTYKVEMNHHAQHRIVSPSGKKGEWVGYQSLAFLEEKGRVFVSGTQYGLLSGGSELRDEKVFELKEVPTEAAAKQSRCSARKCGECDKAEAFIASEKKTIPAPAPGRELLDFDGDGDPKPASARARATQE
jgi:hypothetical protein